MAKLIHRLALSLSIYFYLSLLERTSPSFFSLDKVGTLAINFQTRTNRILSELYRKKIILEFTFFWPKKEDFFPSLLFDQLQKVSQLTYMFEYFLTIIIFWNEKAIFNSFFIPRDFDVQTVVYCTFTSLLSSSFFCQLEEKLFSKWKVLLIRTYKFCSTSNSRLVRHCLCYYINNIFCRSHLLM